MRLRTVRQVKQQQQFLKRRNSKKMEVLSSKVSLFPNVCCLKLNWKVFHLQKAHRKFFNLIKFKVFLNEIQHDLIISYQLYLLLAFHRNLLSLNLNNEPATKSIVQLSALEAESIVDYFISTMYAQSHQESMHNAIMNGNMIEASLIPGSTGMSPSPTIMQQQHGTELYSNGNVTAHSLRTHSSKFPVSIICDWVEGLWLLIG